MITLDTLIEILRVARYHEISTKLVRDGMDHRVYELYVKTAKYSGNNNGEDINLRVSIEEL